jgi:large subunit ribosomal protein L23
MALFDKKTEQTDKPVKSEVKASKANTGDAFRVLVKPLVSEKSFKVNALGQYVFRVNPKANKISIRNAVEKVYDVHVVRVNVLNVRGKERNFGQIQGRTSDWKKAIVTLKKGETIGAGN